MEWSVRYFLQKSSQWETRARASRRAAGPAAYSFRQAALWSAVAAEAEDQFAKLNKEYKRLITQDCRDW